MKRQLEQDRFEHWVSVMDDVLAEFFASLPAEVGGVLDYSAESLNSLEAWLLSRFDSHGAYQKNAPTPLVDGCARYVGEVFRKKLGGHWELQLDNPKDVNFNIPLIVGYANQATPVCPHHLVSASASRRTGTYLSGVLGMQRKLVEGTRG